MTNESTAAHARDGSEAPPASQTIAEFLRAQARVPPRGWSARLCGRSPLSVASRWWFWPALGEFKLCRDLSRLGDEHAVLHQVPASLNGVPVGHVVIGPTGVFAVQAVYAAGQEVEVSAVALTMAGHPLSELRRLQQAMGAIERCLSEEVGGEVRVSGVLALIEADALAMDEVPRDIVALHSADVATWVQQHPHTLSGERVRALQAAAHRPATWAGPPAEDCVGPGGAARVEHARREVIRARLIRQLWILATVVVSAAAVAGLALSRVLSAT